ncbi:hypothetical protein [Marinomonas mediterranea]|uniref:hypothetical protein n=2 Tax=Marinomonas mediterranea TaxID=119864 RepID=UPI0023491ACD|nr:hypothetical protein [Marinomonas mediterranea]
MQRISSTELGFDIAIQDTQMIGAFDHIYEDNFNAVEGINTHYVALGYRVKMNPSKQVSFDTQHSEMKWMTEKDLMASEFVHANTKAYFK